MVVERKVLHRNQAVAAPERLGTDLVCTMVQKIQKDKRSRRRIGLIKMNISQAFPSI